MTPRRKRRILSPVKKRDKETYVKVGDRPDEPKLLCAACGREEVVRCPIPIAQMVDVVNGFHKRHADCRRR